MKYELLFSFVSLSAGSLVFLFLYLKQRKNKMTVHSASLRDKLVYDGSAYKDLLSEALIFDSKFFHLLVKIINSTKLKLLISMIGGGAYLGLMILTAPAISLKTMLAFASEVLVAFILLFVFITIATSLLASSRYKKSSARILLDLPVFCDLIAISIKSGATPEDAIRSVLPTLKNLSHPISAVFILFMHKVDALGFSQALLISQNSTNERHLAFFFSALRQSNQFGTAIVPTLMDMSAELRESAMLAIEEKVGKLASKMSIPLILLIMFPIVIMILAPAFIKFTSLQ